MLQFHLEADCSFTVPQLPRFQQISTAASQPFDPSHPLDNFQWEGCPQPSSITHSFAAWSQAAAAACGVTQQGPGTHFAISNQPLVPRSHPERVWHGHSESFWDRVAAWAKKRPIFSDGLPLSITSFLNSSEAHWASQVNITWAEWKDEALSFLRGDSPSQRWLEAVTAQRKHARADHLASKSAQYHAWLQTSVKKGMRPLFRALSNPDAKVDRPFRDVGLELRPFLRLEFWTDLWQAQPLPLAPLSAELHERAREHALSLQPLTLDMLLPKLRKLANKAGGADGWSYAQLKLLPDEALQALLLIFRSVECDGVLPEQWLTTLITMLPKNLKVERPIALCNAPYRLWAKLRYPEVENWILRFQEKAPWEQAIPGQSTLDVSISRLLSAEIARVRKRSRIVLFVDLQTFYESVSHAAIAEQALIHQFPAVCVDTALKVYRGARYILSESAVSPACYAASGLMAGCPYAPALAKLALYPSLSTLRSSNLTDNITAWLDDISVDTEGPNAAHTAARAHKSFQLLKSSLSKDGLNMSLTKTCFVCSDTPAEKALTKLIGPNDPPVSSLARDLGTDYSGARRRRITIAKERQAKGRTRATRLRKLLVPSLSHKWRAFKGGVFTTAAWGHQAQGLAPKRLKWLRASAAQQLNRHKLGSSDLVFDLHHKFEDPLITIVTQHFITIVRIFRRWPLSSWSQLKSAWECSWERLRSTKYPWQVVSGPLAAAQAYLLQFDIECRSLDQWTVGGTVLACQWRDKGFKEVLLSCLRGHLLTLRNARIANILEDSAILQGLDWSSHRRKITQLAKCQRPTKWLRALWQGAVLCQSTGGQELCPLCGTPATWKHVLLDCDYWQTRHRKPPLRWQDLQQRWPSPTMWERGLLPAAMTQQSRPGFTHTDVREGLWASEARLDAHRFVFSTDATGGPDSADVRRRIVAFAVVAFEKTHNQLSQVAAITGYLPVGVSVADGETRALQVLQDNTYGDVDVTVDCQTAIKRAKSFGTHLQCHWVRSHLSLESFRLEFGEHNLWRHEANKIADQLCDKVAMGIYDRAFSCRVQFLDSLVQEISAFLSERVEILVTSKKDPPPQFFQEKRGSQHHRNVTASQAFAKPRRAEQQALSATATRQVPGPSKKQRLLHLLEDPSLHLGHDWKATDTKADNNFAVKCQRCGLYIEQCNAPDLFSRKLNHPCQDIPAALPDSWSIHPSHSMVNKGAFFACSRCLAVVRFAAKTATKTLLNPCKGLNRNTRLNLLRTKTHTQVSAAQHVSIDALFRPRAESVPAKDHKAGPHTNFFSRQGQTPQPEARKPLPPVPKPKAKPKSASPGSGPKQTKLSFGNS